MQGLKCAWTGRPLRVRVSVSPRIGASWFAVHDGASPIGRDFPTLAALSEALSMRDGVAGVARGDDAARCAYTGVRLELREVAPGRWRAEGGFDPYLPQGDPEAFVAGCRGRAGRLVAATPSPRIDATEAVEPERPADEGLRDEFGQMAEDMQRDFRKRERGTTTVAVPEGAPAKSGSRKPAKKGGGKR